MNDGGCPCMQEQQALQDLPAPTSQYLGLHHLEPLQVPGGRVELTEQLTAATLGSPCLAELSHRL